MAHARIIQHIEIAQIEIEYAVADFLQRLVSVDGQVSKSDLEAALTRLQSANGAMRAAFGALTQIAAKKAPAKAA